MRYSVVSAALIVITFLLSACAHKGIRWDDLDYGVPYQAKDLVQT